MLPPAATTIAMSVSQAISARRESFTTDPVPRAGRDSGRGASLEHVEGPTVPTELSPHNPRIERVRELRTARGRAPRSRFAVEGPTLLEEAGRSGLRPREIYLTATALGRFDPGHYEAEGVPVFQVPERAFARLSEVETPTGVLTVFDLPARTAAEVLARPGAVLLLAGVNDPGNAGTLVRSAEAFGAAGVLFGRGGADPFAPKVVRAAMGSIFRLPVAAVDPDEIVAAAAAAGRLLIATDVEGEELGVVGIPRNAVFAIGNERRGSGTGCLAGTGPFGYPSNGVAESLNAAVAGSIVLYEAARCQEACQGAEKP